MLELSYHNRVLDNTDTFRKQPEHKLVEAKTQAGSHIKIG